MIGSGCLELSLVIIIVFLYYFPLVLPPLANNAAVWRMACRAQKTLLIVCTTRVCYVVHISWYIVKLQANLIFNIFKQWFEKTICFWCIFGFCKKLLLYEWNSGQLDTFFIKIRFSCNQNIRGTLFLHWVSVSLI